MHGWLQAGNCAKRANRRYQNRVSGTYIRKWSGGTDRLSIFLCARLPSGAPGTLVSNNHVYIRIRSANTHGLSASSPSAIVQYVRVSRRQCCFVGIPWPRADVRCSQARENNQGYCISVYDCICIPPPVQQDMISMLVHLTVVVRHFSVNRGPEQYDTSQDPTHRNTVRLQRFPVFIKHIV